MPSSQKLLEQYEKLTEDVQDSFLEDHIGELRCDGCGLPIAGAFKIVPKNLNTLNRPILLHLFPSKDECCKLRFCNSCGTHINTIERKCVFEIFKVRCDTVLSIKDTVCPKCDTSDDIEITSSCPSCGKENKQELTQKL